MNPDVIVIGAGVIGTACTYFLSRKGLKVLLLERAHLCAGASGATAALISVGGSGVPSDPIRQMTVEGHRLIQELEADFDRPIEKIDGGSLFVAVGTEQARELTRFYEQLRKIIPSCSQMDGPQVHALAPMLTPRVTAAVFNPVNYHVNPFRLCEGYLSAALRQGSRVDYGVTVREIIVSDDRIERVSTDCGDYCADWVVVAAGAQTPQVLSSIGIPLPISPARGQVMITEACPPMTRVVLFFPDHLYVKQTVRGNFYIGSHTEFVGFDSGITLEKMTAYPRILSDYIPIFTRLRGIRFFTGFRPISSDNLPVVGPVPGCSRLIIAAGHGRSGMCLSASTGKAIGEWIAEGSSRLPLGAFRVDRFADPS